MKKSLSQAKLRPKDRRGIVVVLTGFVLTLLFAFVSMSVDSGRIVLTETQMQNAVDAAALAASQEITASIEAAGQGEGDPDADANSIAVQAARQVAADVAAANGVYIDPDTDVQFGKRYYDEAADEWPIAWDESPYNVVRVKARRTNADDLEAPDGELPLAFGWAVGRESVPVATSATAFVEARDLVLVLDFSGSMNDDSDLSAIDHFDQADVEENIREIYEALELTQLTDFPIEPEYLTVQGEPKQKGCDSEITVTFKGDEVFVTSTKDLSNVVLHYSNGGKQKFEGLSGTTGTFSGTGYYSGDNITKCWVKSGCNASGEGPGYGERFDDSNQAVKKAFGLDQVAYPYPHGSWNEYIDYCRSAGSIRDAGYRQMYGGITFVDYLLQKRPRHSHTPDLWKTPHYPFNAVKNGASLFLNFLDELQFGDEVGLVSYATWSEWEDSHSDDGLSIDISGDPINANYSLLDSIQRHHQAAHYDSRTGMGDGILKGREMLVGKDNDPNDEGHSRYGARPTMIIMTDGRANEAKSGWNLPSDFRWEDWTDYDGDGDADYSTTDWKKQYAFWEATECVERGITLHTMAVGAGADRDLMRAIAHAGGGVFISVPGGSTIAEMESQMLSAFGEIAAKVPPAQLVYDLEVEEEPQ